jgi:serine/threonine protein kinase
MPREAPSAYYYLFEWIDGRTLASLAQAGPSIAPAEWVRVARECLNALSVLHRRGIIHRDIKPENLVLQPDGAVRVLDLGVAITRRREDRSGELRAGTPAYINPEQWDGTPADEQSDLFALGVTLFFLLTRKLPYGPIQPYQRAAYQRKPLSCSQLRPDLPLWIDHWLGRAYAGRKVERYQTAEEMLLALERAAISGVVAEREPAPLLQRGTVVLLSVALGLSLLMNVLLVWLHVILSK